MVIKTLSTLCLLFTAYINPVNNKFVGPSHDSADESDKSWTRTPASNKSIEEAVDQYIANKNMAPPALKALAEVHYPSGHVIQPPNFMKYENINEEPVIRWPVDGPDSLYVLAFIHAADPEDVYRVFDQCINWLVVNVPGNNLKAGDTLVPYKRPRSPLEHEKDRYVFLIYKQPSTNRMHFNATAILPDDPRKIFVIEEFVHIYNLGYPIAGNFFRIEK